MDEMLDSTAWQLFADRMDKKWCLVNCDSFDALKKAGLTGTLGSDKNFEQAGIVKLLRLSGDFSNLDR